LIILRGGAITRVTTWSGPIAKRGEDGQPLTAWGHELSMQIFPEEYDCHDAVVELADDGVIYPNEAEARSALAAAVLARAGELPADGIARLNGRSVALEWTMTDMDPGVDPARTTVLSAGDMQCVIGYGWQGVLAYHSIKDAPPGIVVWPGGGVTAIAGGRSVAVASRSQGWDWMVVAGEGAPAPVIELSPGALQKRMVYGVARGDRLCILDLAGALEDQGRDTEGRDAEAATWAAAVLRAAVAVG